MSDFASRAIAQRPVSAFLPGASGITTAKISATNYLICMQEKPPEKTIEQERWPELSFRFLLSTHGSGREIRKFEKLLEKADVYAPEFVGLDAEDRIEIRKLSDNKVTLEEFLDKFTSKYEKYGAKKIFGAGRFFYEMVRSLAGSKKPLMFIDMPKESIESLADIRKLNDAAKQFEGGKFEQSLINLRKILQDLVNKNVIGRERFIVENLKENAGELFATYPELILKKRLQILITFGSIHTTLYHDIKRTFPKADVSREFNFMPYIYATVHEAARKLMFGKPLEEETLARAILGLILIIRILQKLQPNDSEAVALAERKIVSKLTIAEIKTISQRIGSGTPLEKALKEGNVALPATEEEFNKLIGRG